MTHQGNPWDRELESALGCRLVLEPTQRVRVIKHLYENNRDWRLENMAAKSANGRIKIYISLVQWLLAHPETTEEEFDLRCRQSDQAQMHISDINAKREGVMSRLRSMKFKCPQVPETTESSRKCKCGSSDLLTTSRQTRSADEAQTIFFICAECGVSFT